MDFSGPVRLRRGYVAVRRDDQRLQLGVDDPHRVVVPDSPGARRLLAALRAGLAVPPSSEASRRLMAELAEAGLLEPLELPEDAPRARVVVDAPPTVLRHLTPLLAEVGLAVAATADEAPTAPVLVADDGEVGRPRLDRLAQAGRTHLVVSGGPATWTVGPFVVPGRTACQRCVDAHLADRDPRRLVVVEQLARMREARSVDAVLRGVALGHAVRDLRAWADGLQPGTWSATYKIGSGAPEITEWLRHPHCGCAWDQLAGAL